MSIKSYKSRSMKETLKSFYFTLAPKGSKLYSLTHTSIRRILNIRYQNWIKRFDSYSQEDFLHLRNKVDNMETKPLISVIMPVFNPNLDYLNQAIQSVCNQVYPHWELCIADDASTQAGVREVLEKHSQADSRIKVVYRETNGHISAASNSALELAEGEYIALLDHDDMLHPLALFYVAKTVSQYPDCVVFYSDEDKLTPKGQRIDPYFKSDFDYDLFLSQNMISHLGVYKEAFISKVNGFREGMEGSQDYDLMLRILEIIQFSQIHHIPRVLYHWRISEQSVANHIEIKPYALKAGKTAVKDFLSRKQLNATVDIFENFGYQVRYAHSDPTPTVEILLTSQKPVDQIIAISQTLIDQANYDLSHLTVNIETVEGNFRRLESSLHSVYPELNLKISGPMNQPQKDHDQHITDSTADYVAIINDTCAGFSNGWLLDLISFADQPGIGCVSPLLVNEDGSIFSCGLILSRDKIAEYLFQGASSANLNYYFGWSSLHKGYSALPGNCIIVRRSNYVSVGGYDRKISDPNARHLDLCLRLKQAGLRNVVISETMVTVDQPIGSQTSVMDGRLIIKEVNKQYLKTEWNQWFEADPAFNPNLILRKGKPIIAKSPRIDYP